MGKLNGKVAVITGGGSGIGLSIAKLFMQQGASVVIFGRNKDTLKAASENFGGDNLIVPGDVCSLSDLDNLYERVQEKFGRIDILVTSAGSGGVGLIEDLDEEIFDMLSNTNFKGTYFTIQKSVPLFKDGGSIILISSAVNVKGFPGYSIYSAAKAAVRSLARTLAVELSSKGIRVNSLSPGFTDTPFSITFLGDSQDQTSKWLQKASDLMPLQRIGNPDEIASTALFLASHDSSYITGIDIAVDGGLSQV